MSKGKARVFVPLTKVDEAQRLVYGVISQEILDKSGEVMDYETSKPYFEKWSSDIEKASNGLSKGNLRVMHGLSVAGKLTDISFDDDNKAIEVCAKVVDDAEWEKVIEGCYTGFSVGGKYEKRWTDNGVRKYTAGPNEVSLVDNPCVGTATFALVKADGATEEVVFKAVAEGDGESSDQQTVEEVPASEETPVQGELDFPTNEQVVKRAEEMAKAANDGSTWMNHVEAARDDLVKSANTEQKNGQGEGQAEDGDSEASDVNADSSGEAEVTKVTPPGVKQVWAASDGKTFEKKADCEAHEATLVKGAEPTEAEKLKARLEKALNPPTEEEKTELMEDFDRMAKALNALSTPFGEDGKPQLEKGMYTINRFSNVLSDMASLSRSIKAESTREGGDETDSTVSAEIIAAVKTLGASFISYATNQVQELLAGMDDDVIVTHYDYYYNAAKENSEDELAKDVCSLISEFKDSSREIRDNLSKVFGAPPVEPPEQSDVDLSPALAKRFADLEADRDSFKEIAEKAVSQLETLSKRMDQLEDTPQPRAPRGVQPRPGDELEGLSKRSPEEGLAFLQEMLKTHGHDGMATLMIKAAQQSGGQRLTLKS